MKLLRVLKALLTSIAMWISISRSLDTESISDIGQEDGLEGLKMGTKVASFYVWILCNQEQFNITGCWHWNQARKFYVGVICCQDLL